jgi:hypothetical protein
MGDMLYKMGKLRYPITSHNPNTTKTYNNQHEPPPPNSLTVLPSIAMATSTMTSQLLAPWLPMAL